jgi:hypothetical protein
MHHAVLLPVSRNLSAILHHPLSHCQSADPCCGKMLQLHICLLAVWLVSCCLYTANAVPPALPPANATFECGKPLAPCGKALPAGINCPKGAGWCAAGHYCGFPKNSTKAKCKPLPKNCGKAGYECCPSNAETPQTNATNPLNCKPFCMDGSTCVYSSGNSTSKSPEVYAGVTGEVWIGQCRHHA